MTIPINTECPIGDCDHNLQGSCCNGGLCDYNFDQVPQLQYQNTVSIYEHKTNATAMLEHWSKDIEAMSEDTIWCYYNAQRDIFELPNGEVTHSLSIATERYTEYLKSPVEDE